MTSRPNSGKPRKRSKMNRRSSEPNAGNNINTLKARKRRRSIGTIGNSSNGHRTSSNSTSHSHTAGGQGAKRSIPQKRKRGRIQQIGNGSNSIASKKRKLNRNPSSCPKRPDRYKPTACGCIECCKKDNFCFICNDTIARDDDAASCSKCPRSFHSKCRHRIPRDLKCSKRREPIYFKMYGDDITKKMKEDLLSEYPVDDTQINRLRYFETCTLGTIQYQSGDDVLIDKEPVKIKAIGVDSIGVPYVLINGYTSNSNGSNVPKWKLRKHPLKRHRVFDEESGIQYKVKMVSNGKEYQKFKDAIKSKKEMRQKSELNSNTGCLVDNGLQSDYGEVYRLETGTNKQKTPNSKTIESSSENAPNTADRSIPGTNSTKSNDDRNDSKSTVTKTHAESDKVPDGSNTKKKKGKYKYTKQQREELQEIDASIKRRCDEANVILNGKIKERRMAREREAKRREFEQEGIRLKREHQMDFVKLKELCLELGLKELVSPDPDPAKGRVLPSKEAMHQLIKEFERNIEEKLRTLRFSDDDDDINDADCD